MQNSLVRILFHLVTLQSERLGFLSFCNCATFRKSNLRKKTLRTSITMATLGARFLSVAGARVDRSDLDLTPSDCNIGLHLSCIDRTLGFLGDKNILWSRWPVETKKRKITVSVLFIFAPFLFLYLGRLLFYSSPGRGSALCSWARHFTLTLPLSSHVYKWVQGNVGAT